MKYTKDFEGKGFVNIKGQPNQKIVFDLYEEDDGTNYFHNKIDKTFGWKKTIGLHEYSDFIRYDEESIQDHLSILKEQKDRTEMELLR